MKWLWLVVAVLLLAIGGKKHVTIARQQPLCAAMRCD